MTTTSEPTVISTPGVNWDSDRSSGFALDSLDSAREPTGATANCNAGRSRR